MTGYPSYAKVEIASGTIIELVTELPVELDGLANETLCDLTYLDQVPQYAGLGYWPVEILFNQPDNSRAVDTNRKVVVQHTTQPYVPIYTQFPAYIPKRGAGGVPVGDAPEPVSSIICIGNIFARMMHFQKSGDVMQGHKHFYDHPTLLARGRLEVNFEGAITVYEAPCMIYIQQEAEHRLTALDDDTLAFCIHPIRSNALEGDILDPAMIPNGVNPMKEGLAHPLTIRDVR